ncbi:MAG: SDR family oxidoreductase [Chloroflexota bacterium]
MLLKDQIAVITGGGRGIGREIALAYAKAGANVVLAARSQDALVATKTEIEQLGQQALAVPTDITDEASVQNLVETTLSHFGRVDCLVNNSGIAGPITPLWQVDPAAWQQTFAVNVFGTFLCCQAFLPSMLKAKRGSIIVIGSMTGKRPLPNRSTYTSSKMALIGLVRTLAWETWSHNIRVNLISPGVVDGERIEATIQKHADAQGITPDEARHQFTAPYPPHDRFIPAEDVAKAAVFLASDMAASITGDDLNVSAGVVTY